MNYPDTGSSVMLFDESISINSHKSITSQSESKYSLNGTSWLTFDTLFPLYEEMLRRCPANEFGTGVVTLIVSIQAFFTSYMPFMPSRWDYTQRAEKIFRYFIYIIDFGSMEQENLNKGIAVGFIIVITICSFFWFLYVSIVYKSTRNISTNKLRITRFIFSVLYQIIIIPTAIHTGLCYFQIWSDKMIMYIIGTILLLMVYIYLLVMVCYDSAYRGATPYIECTILSSWEGTHAMGVFIGVTLSQLSSIFLIGLPFWTQCIQVVVYSCLHLYIMHRIFYFPYMNFRMNVIFMSGLTSSLSSIIFPLFNIPRYVVMIIPVIVLVLSNIIYYFILGAIRKSVGSNPKFTTELQALRILRVFIADKCEEFVQWRILKDITEQIPTSTVLVRIAQMIAFFPSEGQLLSIYLSVLEKRTDLKINERFLLYQIKRVHILRQTSTSKQFIKDFKIVKEATSQTFHQLSYFYNMIAERSNENPANYLIRLSQTKKKTELICREILETYPNSAALAYEYSRFLIECAGNIKEGVKWYQRGHLIEHGRYSSIDYCYITMANLFPNYLKKRILDNRGKNFPRRKQREASAYNEDMTDIEIEDNEELAMKLIDEPKLRVALKRALDNMKCKTLDILSALIYVRFVVELFAIVIIIGVMLPIFNSRSDDLNVLFDGTDLRYSYDYAVYLLASHWIRNMSLFPYNFTSNNEHNHSDIDKQGLLHLNDSIETLHTWTEATIKKTLDLSYSITKTEKSNTTVYVAKRNKYISIQNLTQCEGNAAKSVLGSVFQAFLYYPEGFDNNWYDINNNSFFCETILNYNTMIDGVDNQLDDYLVRDLESKDVFNKFYLTSFYIAFPLIIILFLVPSISAIIETKGMIFQFLETLFTIPREMLSIASKPLIKSMQMDRLHIVPNKSFEYKRSQIALIFSEIIVCLLFMAIVGGTSLSVYSTSNLISKNGNFLVLCSVRRSLIVETVTNLYLYMITSNSTEVNKSKFFDRKFLLRANQTLETHKHLIQGYNGYPSCNGFNKDLDNVHFRDTCENMPTVFHDLYDCYSLDEMMAVFTKMATNVQYLIKENISDIGNQSIFTHFIDISLNHMYVKANKALDIVKNENSLFIESYRKSILFVILPITVLLILVFIIEKLILDKLKLACNYRRVVFSRFPPMSIVSNHAVLDYILGHSFSSNIKKISRERALVHYQTHPIIIITKECIISYINESASTTFGYTFEQVAGQNITQLFNIEDCDVIHDSINQRNFMNSITIIGKDDNDHNLHLDVTLFEHDNMITMFIQDETKIKKLKSDLQCAKDKVNAFMEVLLPNGITQKQFNNNKNIHYVAKMASVMFLNVVKFTDFSTSIGSKFVLSNIETIIRAFDNVRKKYPTIFKVKTFGDIYFCASGIFEGDYQSNEMVHFAIECNLALDEVNQVLCTNFQCRTGIESGGPVEAGIIGDPMSSFEVFGEPVQIAKILEEKCLPGYIKISQEVKNHIDSSKFTISDSDVISNKDEIIPTYHIEIQRT